MSIIFKPHGQLDVSTDPAQLPQTVDGKGIIHESGAMTRCKNLRLNEGGVARTRYGSSKLNATAIPVAIGHIAEQEGYRYAFGTSIYQDEVSIGSGYTSADWMSMLYNAYNSTTKNLFALNGTERVRIDGEDVYNWGIDAPTVAPTLGAGSGSGLTGDYNAKYSYCRKEGTTVVCESNLSPAAASAQALTDDPLSVTWTASADAQVTHVRIYRTLADGLIYYHDKDVAIGTTTTTTTTSDAGLGTIEHDDHDRPPAGTVIIGPNYDGACFIIKDNRVYFALSKRPEYWPSDYYVEAGPIDYPLVAACFFNGQLHVASKHEIYLVAGSGPETYFPYGQNALTGARGRFGMLPIKGLGILHVGKDGIYLFNTGADNKLTGAQYDKVFRGEDSGAMPGVGDLSTAWLIQHGNTFYFGYAAADNTYPQHVIAYDLSDSKTTYIDWGIEIPAVCVDRENERLLGVDTDGYIWHLEDSTKTADGTAAIAWDIQSKDFTLSTRAHFPRWNKYDIDASAATSVTGELILDGVAHKQHTITGNRVTRRRLIDPGNGQRCALRVHGTGPVAIYTVESE